MSADERDLSGKTVRGIAWVSIGRVAAQLVQTVTVIALMRLLTPEDFGVMAMVIVFTGLATAVCSLGFSMALVQAPEASPELLDTAFWTVLAISVLAAGLMVLAAPAIESYYEPPPIQWTGKCLSFSSVPHPRWSQKLPLRQRRRGVEVS